MKPGLLESLEPSYSTQRLPCSENTYLARRTLSMEQLFSQGLSNGDSPKGSAMAIVTALILVYYCAPPRSNDQKC